ncbi:MAG: hypothetical protein NT014_05750 [Candidatus Omnitrophica bacterium]|nr:hypothetical protein [Candidatus Omnitrophota bacterium]
MNICLRVISIFVILTLVAGSTFEYVYAGIHQDCSCCSSKCQGAKNCHETTKVCLCRYSAPLQVYLLKSDLFPKLVFSGSFAQKLSFTYVFLSTKDIFHPPNALFS